MYFVLHDFASVHCCLVVTCWERVDLLALVCDVTFPCGIMGQVCYLIVSIADLYHLSYFKCILLAPNLSVVVKTRNMLSSHQGFLTNAMHHHRETM